MELDTQTAPQLANLQLDQHSIEGDVFQLPVLVQPLGFTDQQVL